MNKVKVSEVCYVNEWRHRAFREGNEREERTLHVSQGLSSPQLQSCAIFYLVRQAWPAICTGALRSVSLGYLRGGEAPQLHPRERTGPDWPAPNGNAVNIHVYSQVLFTHPCDIAGQNWSRETGCLIDRGNGESWWWWDFGGERELLTAPFGVACI